MIENNNEPNLKEPNEYLENDDQSFIPRPERHGCVTSWLILMLIGNSIFALIYLVRVIGSTQVYSISKSLLMTLVITGLLNTVFSIMLLFWKKIAFYGLGITAILIFSINLAIGLPKVKALRGAAGFVVLYGILQIKKNGVSAWDYLK